MNIDTSAEPRVEVLASGGVSVTEAEHAGAVIGDVLSGAIGPVPTATVTLSVLADPDLPRPSLVQATVEQGPLRLRAQAAAPSPREAVDLLRQRLAVRWDQRRAS